MKFFFDHDVAADVAMVLRQRGHDVVELRTVLPADTADEIVWAPACADARVMVSGNRNTKEPKGNSEARGHHLSSWFCLTLSPRKERHRKHKVVTRMALS